MMRPFRYCSLPLTAALMIAPAGVEAQSAVGPTYYGRPGSVVPFSPAVRAGDLIFLSGQIGVTADGKIPATMAEQARLAMDALGASLKLAGASYDDVVKCTVMLADMSQWSAFNTVYATYFKPGRLPARSALGATALAFGAGVEVECIAWRPQARR